jgi:hypothetical protein
MRETTRPVALPATAPSTPAPTGRATAASRRTAAAELYAWDLENVASGPTKLSVSGTVPTHSIAWNLYPTSDGGDGSYYAFRGNGAVYGSPPYPLADDQSLYKLTPPDSSPLTSPWVFSRVPISGGITELGRRAVVTGLKLRELFVLPELASAPQG